MDIDEIRGQMAMLQQDIAEIIQEMKQVQRDSSRSALQQELKEKRDQYDVLNNQINVAIGNENDISGANMIIGASSGGSINQYNESNKLKMNVKGGLHIYPDAPIYNKLNPIDIDIIFSTVLSKEVLRYDETVGVWIFKQTIAKIKDIWKPEIPYKVIAIIKDTITSETQKSVLYNGYIYLKHGYRGITALNKNTISTKNYEIQESDRASISNSIVQFLDGIGKSGYDVESEVIRFSRSNSVGRWTILVYEEDYYYRKYVGNDVFERALEPEFRHRAGLYEKTEFSMTLVGRKR